MQVVMRPHSLPSPPAEDTKATIPRKSNSSSTKSVKPAHRTPKRANSSVAHAHHHDHLTQGSGMDGRHKRVWKACERCRMKKTKCDGEFPCKRCKDDGLICTAGVRKKVEYKQLPRGYAEVLENSQLSLTATIHKLFTMVRNSQTWELAEPELNDRGQPVVHNIAQLLGCIRPNSDIDLPVQSVFPENEAALGELARQLEQQQKETEVKKEMDTSSPSSNGTDRAPSSDLDPSDLDPYQYQLEDYSNIAFNSGSNTTASSNAGNDNIMTLSPQSFTPNSEFEQSHGSGLNVDFNSMSYQTFPHGWSQLPQQGSNMSMHFMPAPPSDVHGMNVSLNHGQIQAPDDTIQPHLLNSEMVRVMMGSKDPMMYQGFDGEVEDFRMP